MINANTTFFTLHADFDGYSYLDGILGNATAKQYAADITDDGKEFDPAQYDILADYLSHTEGYWMDRKSAEEALEEAEGVLRNSGSIKEFTAREATDAILKMASDE